MECESLRKMAPSQNGLREELMPEVKEYRLTEHVKAAG